MNIKCNGFPISKAQVLEAYHRGGLINGSNFIHKEFMNFELDEVSITLEALVERISNIDPIV